MCLPSAEPAVTNAGQQDLDGKAAMAQHAAIDAFGSEPFRKKPKFAHMRQARLPPHLPTSSPPHLLTSSPPHLLTASRPHVLTSSPSHHLTSSPPHLLTSSPPHLLTSSPPHLLTSSPPHLLTSSPPHHLTTSPPHLLTTSPPHIITSSPPHVPTSSPPHHLTSSHSHRLATSPPHRPPDAIITGEVQLQRRRLPMRRVVGRTLHEEGEGRVPPVKQATADQAGEGGPDRMGTASTTATRRPRAVLWTRNAKCRLCASLSQSDCDLGGQCCRGGARRCSHSCGYIPMGLESSLVIHFARSRETAVVVQ